LRLIGVIDLAGGRAVHARRGVRARYAPVGVAAGCPIDGDPIALARTYVDRLGLAELYAADLDAIAAQPQSQKPGESPDLLPHETLITSLATVAPLWLDAAISSPARSRQALALGATRVVVGLETLESFDVLSAICAALDKTRVSSADPLRGIRPTVAFSLDLRDGVPIAPRLNIPSSQPGDLAARAVDAGVSAMIVLDLARVGEAIGPDVAMVTRVRASAPGTTLIAGGGIRGLADLVRLAEAGCDGALVATALHDGRIGAEDVRGLRHVSKSL
jgi:phosphoribosylformimino-5-aminoimidazole carboxamide ribotide isomerase